MKLIPGSSNLLVRLTVACVLSLVWLCDVPRLRAHGLDLPKPTPEQLAQTQPPLKGAKEFAGELAVHLRSRLTQEQALLMDSIVEQFAAAERIGAGETRGLEPADAGYYHWRAEQSLLGLLPQVTDVVPLDFRQGLPRPGAPLELDQQYNLLLLKVVTGVGAPHFTVHEMNMTTERDRHPYTISIASNATTYVAVKLEQVPSDLTIFNLVFQFDGAERPAFSWTLSFRSKPGGQVAVRVLDEKGQPVPVLLRLTSGAGQRLVEPAGAVDLSPMMNEVTSLPIYGPGRGYMVYIPGPFQGRYWIVPKPFEMPLPAGEWEVHILHGIEYEPVRDRFQVEPGKWARKTYRLKRWTNMPRQGWYSGDDHVHSRLMSSEDAEKLLAFARAGDIHVSNVLEMGNEMRTWYAQRGFGPDFQVQDGNHWLVPGQEDPRSMLGHAIGLNLQSKVRDLNRYCLNDWIAGEIHRQGGLYGHTHVGNSEVKSLFTERQMALFTPMGIVDFNSILQNKLGLDLFYDYLNLGFRMTASAGTDTPYGGTVGSVRMYAYCGTRKPLVPATWFDALKQGRTFVTTGPMLDFRVEDARPGDQVSLVKDRPLRVKIRAWGLRGASAPVQLRLVQFGRLLQEVAPSHKDQDELELETTVSSAQSCWLAAYARGLNGSEAHTTPIYLVKPGERFWDPTQADLILRKQLTILDEIEHALETAASVMKSGNNPMDYWNRWPAEQGTQIRERVARTRQMYLDMQAQLGVTRPPSPVETPRAAIAPAVPPQEARTNSVSLRIALLQMAASGTNQAANLAKADDFCRRAAAQNADLAVMPEMWNIGYTGFFDPDPQQRDDWQVQAIKSDGPWVSHFRALARQLDMAIAVTYLEQWPGAPRNSVTLIDRHGREAFTYAKMHTCDFAAFEASTTPGEEVQVAALDTRGGLVRIGAMICFDREFPETARLLMLKEAEVVIVPNACRLDDIRLAQFMTRAVENAMGLAMANYPDPTCGGRSVAYMADGNRIALAEAGETVLLADFPIQALRGFRQTALWGNAFRRPHRYGALSEPHHLEVFYRTNAFGARFISMER